MTPEERAWHNEHGRLHDLRTRARRDFENLLASIVSDRRRRFEILNDYEELE